VLVTGVTGAILGGLAWYEKRAGARALTDAAMTQVARLTSEHAERFFRDAEPAVRLGPTLVAQGLLDPGDLGALERYVIGVLRARPDLSWSSYGDRDDRFVGAWRDGERSTYVNRSFPRAGRIRLEEERFLPDGRRAPVRVSDDHRVVGPAVNLAGRIESLTVGPEILLSRDLQDRAKGIARVGEPRAVALKGIAGPVVIYELMGVVGEEDAPPSLAAGAVNVNLGADCYRLDGKVVLEPSHRVRVTRLDLRGVRFETDEMLPESVLDVKLVIDFSDGHPGDGTYARIALRRRSASKPDGGVSADAAFTSLDEGDRQHIASLLTA